MHCEPHQPAFAAGKKVQEKVADAAGASGRLEDGIGFGLQPTVADQTNAPWPLADQRAAVRQEDQGPGRLQAGDPILDRYLRRLRLIDVLDRLRFRAYDWVHRIGRHKACGHR